MKVVRNMTVQKETVLQRKIQKELKRRGAYLPNKSHGNMMTAAGIADLRFCYKGLALHFEIKTPEKYNNVSRQQGIHCRLAQSAGGITAIVTNVETANYILDCVDEYVSLNGYISFNEWIKSTNYRMWDDGTRY